MDNNQGRVANNNSEEEYLAFIVNTTIMYKLNELASDRALELFGTAYRAVRGTYNRLMRLFKATLN